MEEIIINGVDVLKCRFYTDIEYIQNENGYTECHNYCSEFLDHHCEKHIDCYYKQLKRKEKDYNELEDTSIEIIRELRKENKELRELLRKSCNHYVPGGECSLTAENCHGTAGCIDGLLSYKDFCLQKIEALKQECEELKK